MKKFITILLAFGFLAVALCCAIAGYRNYRLYVISHGTSEASIRIDTPGSCVVTVDPPGRSLFRPGGVLEIFVTRNGTPVQLEGIAQGSGNIRVTDRTGDLSLECSLDDLSAPYPNHGQYRLMREFDTSHGGPYRVGFDITEPIRGLEGTSQRLVARHFICGEEPLIHFLQFGAAGFCGAASFFLFRRLRTARKTKPIRPQRV